MPHTLLIPLVGPMQAWGSRSRFDDRDTHPEPTKSGVLGLVCAALGRGRTESIDDLAEMRFGVRSDVPGMAVSDFQTAQRVLRASGGGTTSVTSRRHYLSDAVFLAGLESASLALVRAIEAALMDPVWVLSLGRKGYPLTAPPYLPWGSVREGVPLEQALAAEPWRPLYPLPEWRPRPDQLRVLVEDLEGEDGAIADVPLAFDRRQFGLRRVRSHMAPREGEGEAWSTCPSSS